MRRALLLALPLIALAVWLWTSAELPPSPPAVPATEVFSHAEIADSLETTLATVKWRIYKARETVAAELVREGYGRSTRPAKRTA